MNYLTEGKEKTHEFYQTIIRDHMKRRKSIPEDDANCLIDDMIDAFLDEKERRGEGEDGFYCTRQMLHLLSDIFGAGLDTTMATLWWFVLLMARHPDAQVQYSFINTAAKFRLTFREKFLSLSRTEPRYPAHISHVTSRAVLVPDTGGGGSGVKLKSSDTVASHGPSDTVASHGPSDTVASHGPSDTVASHGPSDTVASHGPCDTVASHGPIVLAPDDEDYDE
jgi:hypothetical protein